MKAMKAMKYDVDYFIKKFSKIPASKWTMGKLRDGNRCCALGHCGATYNKFTKEAISLHELSEVGGFNITQVNDDQFNFFFPGTSPKTRILDYLRNIKKKLK